MSERVFNLNFHGLGEPPARIDPAERRVWLSRESFIRLMDFAAGRSDTRITFDDGNETDRTIALTALVDRGLKAEFFVCAGRLGRPGHLSVGHVREMVAVGMTIGSHGMDHKAWRGLGEAELRREIIEARDVLEQAAGQAIRHAACPFGAYDRKSLEALRRAGFERVYTSDGGSTSVTAWLQARTTVLSHDTAQSVSRMIDRLNGRGPGIVKRMRQFLKRARLGAIGYEQLNAS
jgi:peptidoglycan/xylan/chitin deacetylase (PgdA/CDA1 family)